jgi:hypothetical protein
MLENRTFNIIYIRPDNLSGWDAKKSPDAVINYTGKEVMVRL